LRGICILFYFVIWDRYTFIKPDSSKYGRLVNKAIGKVTRHHGKSLGFRNPQSQVLTFSRTTQRIAASVLSWVTDSPLFFWGGFYLFVQSNRCSFSGVVRTDIEVVTGGAYNNQHIMRPKKRRLQKIPLTTSVLLLPSVANSLRSSYLETTQFQRAHTRLVHEVIRVCV
jgi:hypothetical protein